MKPTGCGQLDDYLDGELAAGAMGTFDEHLDTCMSCRRAVEEYAAARRLLKRAFAVEQAASLLTLGEKAIEVVQSTSVWRRRNRQLRLRSSFGRLAAGLVAVAAVLLLWAAASSLWTPDPDSPQRHVADNTTVESNKSSPAIEFSSHRPKATVRVANDERSVAIPMPSTHDNVTIVWIYPTVQ